MKAAPTAGASSRIGAAAARALVADGYPVEEIVVSARARATATEVHGER